MSESLDRATRRDLRRTVGTEAHAIIEAQSARLIEHDHAIAYHAEQLSKTIRELASLIERVHELADRLLIEEARIDDIAQQQHAQKEQDDWRYDQSMPFLVRMRRLTRGR